MVSLKRFNTLSSKLQIHLLMEEGVLLDLAMTRRNAEVVLFAYDDFYVELVVSPRTDDILSIRAFQSLERLEPYLQQIDLSEITALLVVN